MSWYEIILIAAGVAMDAFAVSVTCGIASRDKPLFTAFEAGIFFGLFQLLMPVIGWWAGQAFKPLLVTVDHWVAFALLAGVGGKMIYEALSGAGTDEAEKRKSGLLAMLVLAVATSIDALAVGASLAFINVPVIAPAATMGIVTFAFSFCGVYIGSFFGHLFEKKVEVAGGIVLILIGLKILLEHMA